MSAMFSLSHKLFLYVDFKRPYFCHHYPPKNLIKFCHKMKTAYHGHPNRVQGGLCNARYSVISIISTVLLRVLVLSIVLIFY